MPKTTKKLVLLAYFKKLASSYWLGGRDDVVEGRWMWAQTDQVFNFTDWYPGLPDNIARNENCLHMYAPYKLKWNDVTCAGLYRFICEKES
ncbi:hypothetical protein AM593_07222, partial [Mytilus galloprovincialis]